MEQQIEKTPSIDILEEEETTIRNASSVVLYNDDWHTFEEVINQLIKAINCTFEKARDYAFEVHVKGKSIVFNGSMKDCLRVSSVLEEIALNTQIIS
jgi:ATP-dependent Clp protease adaptor protein ClpS